MAGATAGAASGAAAPCDVKAAAPVAIGTQRVSGRARFQCAAQHHGVMFTLTLQVKPGKRWEPALRHHTSYGTVAARRLYSVRRGRTCVPGTWRTRAVLTVGGRKSTAVSGTAQMTCGLPVVGASCDSTAQTPTVVNGQVIASGTVKCAAKASLGVDVQLQLYFNGQWNVYAEHQDGGFTADANTTYTFATHPAPCPADTAPNQPPPPDQYRTLFSVDSGRGPVTKISPPIVLSCS